MNYYIDTEFLEGSQKTWRGGQTKPTIDLISIGIVSEGGSEYYAISKDFNLKEAWNRFQIEKDNTVGARIGALPDQKKVYWLRDNILEPIYADLIGREADKIIKCAELNLKYHNPFSFMPFQHKTDYKPEFCYSTLKKLISIYGKSNTQIAQEIICFVNNCGINHIPFNPIKHPPFEDKWAHPTFYGYFADYDWVAFCWMFGKMVDLPKGFPMYCRDLKQMLDEATDRKKWYYGKDIWSNTSKKTDALQKDDRLATLKEKLEKIKKHDDYPKQMYEHNALADARWNKELHNFIKTL